MSFSAPDSEVEASGASGGFQAPADEVEGPSLGGLASNAVSDVKDMGSGLLNSVKEMAMNPVKAEMDAVTGIPKAIIGEGQRLGAGKLLSGHPLDAAKQFGQAAYQKPVSTALDFAPALGLLGEVGPEAAMAEKAPGIAPQAATEGMGAAEAAPKPPPPPPSPEAPPPQSPPASGVDPMQAVHDYIAKSMGPAADKIRAAAGQIGQRPDLSNIAADYLKEHSQNMTLKELGAAPGQVRKIGVDHARALADYALENGLAGPKIGTIGRERLIPQQLEQAGGAVGGFRKMAADRGAVHDPAALVDQIRTQLDQKYLGKTQLGDEEIGTLNSSEAPQYKKALAQISQGGRADDLSEKISELFREAKNQDRLSQPSGALGDVARAARQINDAAIAKTLSPEETALYHKALEDYGALTQINEFVKRRASVTAGGRLGPGSGISRAATQKFLDEIGYRTEAKIARNLSDWIRQTPGAVQEPKNIFRKYIDEAAEAIGEMGER